MRKKFWLLMCCVFVVGLCVSAKGATPIDDPNYNLSFEFHWPDACGVVTQIYGHTGIQEEPPTPSLEDPNQGVWNWLSIGLGFQGVDVFCPNAIDSPTHCHQWPATDGIVYVYLQHSGYGIYQVLDGNDANAVITAGRQYTMKFDALDVGTAGIRGEFYSAAVDPIASKSFILLPELFQPVENCDVGENELDDLCRDWYRDLEVSFIALEGDAYLGETLSIRFEAELGDDYAFMDNVRLEWKWLTSTYYPSPEDGAEYVAQTATLNWSPGLWAQSADCHEIYFGTSWSDVNDADSSDVSGIYRGTQNRDVNYYNPPEIPYELGKTYYWRVDEVNTAFVGPSAAAPDAEGRWKGNVWSFTVEGRASDPTPADGTQGVDVYTVLKWQPGTGSGTHDVYLGADESAVENATTASIEYVGNFDVNSYFPGPLKLDAEYYWRIDEVNDAQARVIKGYVWQFTTSPFIVIDDFESYDHFTNPIWDTWIDGWINWTGAEIYLQIGDVNYIRGEEGQSMQYAFRNSDFPYYSETSREFNPAQDWTPPGAKILTLYFRADFYNDQSAVQPMFVFVSDGIETDAFEYPHPQDLRKGAEGWQQWNIDLQEIADAGVDLTNIKEMGIVIGEGDEAGDGYVYFDDIRLISYVTNIPPVADAGPDQTVYTNAELPADFNLIGWWKFDEGTGIFTEDSSAYSNDGEIFDATWTTGYPGDPFDSALDFDGDGVVGLDRVICAEREGNTPGIYPAELMPSDAFTIACWVNLRDFSYFDAMVSNTEDTGSDECGFALYNGGWQGTIGNDFGFMLRTQSIGYMQYLETENLYETNTWYHVAGVYDGNYAAVYVDGALAAGPVEVGGPMLWESATLGNYPEVFSIGAYDDADEFYLVDGKIDDVRYYNYPLNQGEIATLAGLETAQVTLDGSGSYDADDDEITYSWSMGGYEIATGVSPTIYLPVGEHTIELIVNDGQDDSEPDQVVITVVSTPDVEATMELNPPVLNCNGGNSWFRTALVLPEGFLPEDVDTSTPAVTVPGDIESTRMEASLNDEGLTVVEIDFKSASLCEALTPPAHGLLELTVIGSLTDGRNFYATDKIKIKQ